MEHLKPDWSEVVEALEKVQVIMTNDNFFARPYLLMTAEDVSLGFRAGHFLRHSCAKN